MRAANDVTIPGPALADALRRILPRDAKLDPGYVVIRPAGAGMVTLEGFYATASVPAEGAWSDAVNAPGTLLRNITAGDTPPAVRLVFFDRVLSINGATVSAYAVTDDDMPSAPQVQPRNRSAPRARPRRR